MQTIQSLLFVSTVFMASTLVAAERKKPSQPAPTMADVAYDSFEQTKLDFWKAEGKEARPLLVYIHGGGWCSGDKTQNLPDVQTFVGKGVSVASINYRLSTDSPLPSPVHDAARALQFLRSKAGEWNIDKSRVVLTGGSAGGCTSLWLLTHDDLADPKATDLVKRESTRVLGAAVAGAQASIDPKQIETWLGPNGPKHKMICAAVGESNLEAALAKYPTHEELYKEFSACNHVSKDDPPLYMTYGNDVSVPAKSASHGIHHPMFGMKMKELYEAAGLECYLNISGVQKSGGYDSSEAFILSKLGVK